MGDSLMYPSIATYSTDSSGNVTGLVGPGGAIKTIAIRSTPVRIATFGDSTANVGATQSPASQDTTRYAASNWQSGLVSIGSGADKWATPYFYPQAYLVCNGGVSGDTTTQMLARDSAAYSTTRKSITDVLNFAPDVVFLRGGSINDITGVTSATVASVVAAVYARHVQIIQRIVSSGVRVVDEGIFGFSGTATDLASVRSALLQLNILFAAYAAQYPGLVEFINPVGNTCDATGAYIAGMSTDGTHLNGMGSIAVAREEGEVLTRLFGSSTSVRYPGYNNLANPFFGATTSPGYGTVATNLTFGVSNGTRQNAKVEALNGKLYQTCEIVISATTNYLQCLVTIDPSATGAGLMAPLNIQVGDVYGLEWDFYISPMSMPSLTVTQITHRIDFRDAIGSGRVVVDQIGQTITLTSEFFGHHATQPILLGDTQANLTSATEVFFGVYTSNASGTYKIGMSQPRFVKLDQTVKTT